MTVVAPPGRQSLGIVLAERAERPVVWPGLGRRAPPPFFLVLAEDSAALNRLSRGRAPGWGAAVAFPGARTIVLRADLPDLDQTLRHELGHLVLRSVVKTYLPLWFDEGYATWGSGELGGLDRLELNLAVALGRVPSLRDLDGLLRGSATAASLAYALAASAVAELDRLPPSRGLATLLVRLEAGEPFALAIETATGMSESRFEDVWRRSLRRRYGLVTWLVAGGLWTLMAIGVFIIVWYQRERDRPRRAALDVGWVVAEEDPVQDGPGGVGEQRPVDPGELGR